MVIAAGLFHAMAASGNDDDTNKAPAATPTVKAPRALFADQVIVEGIHGFTAAEVARLGSAVGERPLTVTVGEVYVVHGSGSYNEVPLATMQTTGAAYSARAGSKPLEAAFSRGAVLSTTTSRLLGMKVGANLRVDGGASLRVAAVVDDRVISGYQLAVDRAARTGVGTHADYVMVTARASDVGSVETAIQQALPTRRLRFTLPKAHQFFSPGGDVLTQGQLDSRFGMFTVRRTATGFVPSPSWAAAHITARRIPQLGLVECNSLIIKPLTDAMTEITRRGWGKIINTADFIYEGGCWNSRMARFEPGTISHHAWGIAVDINVAANPLGAVPRQDPRLVAIMAKYGFTWGGAWLRRDGTHFEWVGPHPTALAG
jgi:hypothetical protein